MKPQLITVAPSEFTRAAARLLRREVLEACAKGDAHLMLSGGNTPLALYALLGDDPLGELPYGKMEVFFGDERWVPPPSKDSNGGEALRLWLIKRQLPPSHFHPFFGDSPDEARTKVEAALADVAGARGEPAMDLTLLGIGDDGHTASLFPGSPALDEQSSWTAETRSPKPPLVRLTVTLPVLSASRHVVFLVRGTAKHEILSRFMDNDPDVVATRVKARRVTVLADLEASSGVALLARSQGRERSKA